ncbi:M28 family peptidase [Lacinutrix salivirga]
MKRVSLLIVLSLMLIGCKTKNKSVGNANNNNVIEVQTTVTYDYNQEALLEHVKELSSDEYQGRKTGTEGAFKAKTYIIEAFSKQGVTPLNAHFEQHFDFKARGKDYSGINILGVIKGTKHTKKYIVLSAHYDHEGIKNGQIYNGADDDASGIAGLIAFAEYFKKNPPKHNVILAAFDAEELGLVGSKYFVKDNVIKQRNLVLNLNMDMISRSDKNELWAVGTRYNQVLVPAIDATKGIGNVKLIKGHDGKDGLDDWTFASDHAPFHKAGIPFIYFGVEDHKDYHKPTDDFENIHPEFYQNTVQTILEVLKKLDNTTL